jgi:hypothetical protein
LEVTRLFRTLLFGFAVLGVAATAATAAPAKKPPTSGPGCRPQVSVILKGTIPVGQAPTAAATLPFDLKVSVTHANLFGKAYVKAAQPQSFSVTSKTSIRLTTGKGVTLKKGLSALRATVSGDRVLIQGTVCKADLVKGATPALTVRKLVVHTA